MKVFSHDNKFVKKKSAFFAIANHDFNQEIRECILLQEISALIGQSG